MCWVGLRGSAFLEINFIFLGGKRKNNFIFWGQKKKKK
jgi:hypothetical protein